MRTERILRSSSDFKQRTELLASRGLASPELTSPRFAPLGGVSENDVALGLFEGEELVATGSLVGRVIQGVAVREDREGQGLTSELLSLLLRHAADAGIWHLFLFTKPVEAPRFAALGFSLVAATNSAALLEWGPRAAGPGPITKPSAPTIPPPSHPDQREGPRLPPSVLITGPGPTALGSTALVVNCNPFTLGHRYLVERAAAASERLYVLVVREDRSEFPFEVRFRLVEEGVSDLENVTVLSGGDYCVSAATFPSYFTGEEEFASVHAELDLTIFATRIAPALSIKKRFVGTEPFSPVTNVYNETMKRLLPRYGIAVEETPRLEIGGEPVSASRVRALLGQGRMEDAATLIPPSTRRWLLSPESAPVLERLRRLSCLS